MEGDQERRSNYGAVRLLQILLTESAHLIWVLRCERVIQQKNHNANEITTRWLKNINRWLTEDKIIATEIKCNRTEIQKVEATWEGVLKKIWDLPNEWIYQQEFLVGRRAWGPGPTQDPNPEPHTTPIPGVCIKLHFLSTGPRPGINVLGEADRQVS